MKYFGMPMGMWGLFSGSFRTQLSVVFGYDADKARKIAKAAKPRYRQIIAELPEFEAADRFKMNEVNCAMLGAFVLSMPQRPEVEPLTRFYADAMMTKPMRWFCRKSGKNKFTAKDLAAMRQTEALKAADRNPYSWNMDLYEYTMAEAGGTADFVREYTLASGGPYCDCGYKKKPAAGTK